MRTVVICKNDDERARVITVPLDLPLEEIRALCRRFGVRTLAVFGSATTDRFDPTRSDVDFLVDFTRESKTLEIYFAFKSELEQVLGRTVDLVAPQALRNPYFAASVEETRQELYAA